MIDIEQEQIMYPNAHPNLISGTRPIRKEVEGAIANGHLWALMLRSSEAKQKYILDIIHKIEWEKNRKATYRQARFMMRY